MARKLIYQVNMQAPFGTMILGYFTDDFLARQTVDRLYDKVRELVVRDDPTVAVVTEDVKRIGWDQWYDTNRHSADAIFSYSPVYLYNSVPAPTNVFTFVQEPDVIPF